MADDKSLFSALENIEKIHQRLVAAKATSKEDVNNAEICAIVKKMMLHKNMDDDDIGIIIDKLEPIYSGGHRHSYSNISSAIYAEKNRTDNECKKQNRDNDVLDVLAENISSLHDAAVKRYGKPSEEDKEWKTDVLIKYNKLYDHINLETVRLKNYDDQIDNALHKFEELNNITKEQIEEFNGKITDTSNEFNKKIESEMEKTKIATSKMQSEYISILGIFASIVLAFTGGMVYSTSVLDNIYKSSIYRTIIVTALVGMIFIVMIWLLMDFIKSMRGKIKRNYYYIIIPEAVLIAIILFTGLAYRVKWFSGEEKVTYCIYENNTEYEEYEKEEK